MRHIAKRRAHRHHPADVTVVIRTQQIHGLISTARPLIQVVRQIARKISGVAIRLHQHTVLIITKVGGAKPQCAILFENVAALAQNPNRLIHCAGLMQRILVEEHVKLRPELL